MASSQKAPRSRGTSENPCPAPADDTSASANPPHRRVVYILALATVCAVELWGLSRYFPPGSWLSGQPFYTNSYALHFARGLMGEAALRRHLRLWSYSPSLMAGYPAGTRTEPMGAAVAVWLWLASGLTHGQSPAQAAVLYKLLVVGLLSAAPPAMACAALWLGFGWSVALISAVLAAFGIFNYPGLLMIRGGMFAFLAASFLCVAWGAFVYRALERGGAWRFAVLAACGGALTYLHPLTAILLAPPALGGMVASRGRRRAIALAASLAAVFILSLGWLGPILLTVQIGRHFSNWWQTPQTLAGGLLLLFRWRLPFPPLAVAAAAAYGAPCARTRRRFTFVWLAATLAFAALAYFGSTIKAFDDLEPGRMETAFYFYAAPFAALGAHRCWRRLGLMRLPWRRMLRVLAFGAVALFGLVSAASLWLETAVHGPIAVALPAQSNELASWMTAPGRDSRLLLESGWSIDKNGGVRLPYFGADVGPLWALESGRELIGGSPSEGFSSFSFVDFGNGRAFGRPLDRWRPEEFRKQLEIYNVGGLVLWSPGAKRYVAQVPDVKLLLESPPYALYGVAGEFNLLMAGEARSVEAVQDCIRIRGARPGRLVLKYHYFRTLRAWPPMRVRPVVIGNGDPNPFIQVDNDTLRDIWIYNAGFTGLGRPAAACSE